jgi:hypothetical protein
LDFKNDGIDGTGISLFLHPVYFIQFSMLQMKERAKFMPENKVFGQAAVMIDLLSRLFTDAGGKGILALSRPDRQGNRFFLRPVIITDL